MKLTCSHCHCLFLRSEKACPKCGSHPVMCREPGCESPAMVGHDQCLRHFAELTAGVDYSPLDKRH